MRVAFVSDAVFPWHIGGLEAVERTEAEAVATHHNVEFLCMRWPGMQRRFTENNIHYRAFGNATREAFYRHGRRSIRAALVFTISTFRVFLHRYDVIEANMFPFLHIPILKLYGKLFNCPLVLDVVEVWNLKYWTDYLGPILGRLAYVYVKYFCSSANAFIANSSETARKLTESGVNKERIKIFVPILDDKELNSIKDKSRLFKEKRIIFTGRLIREKRLDKWLNVVKQVNKLVPNTKAVIVGNGPERTEILQMIKGKGLSDVVELRPFYENKDDMYKELAASSVYLQMSEREGLSIASLESLALGVPVVIPTHSPIPMEVKEMCIVEEERDIADKIAEIIKSKSKEKYINKKENLSQFSISKAGQFYEKLFEQLGK